MHKVCFGSSGQDKRVLSPGFECCHLFCHLLLLVLVVFLFLVLVVLVFFLFLLFLLFLFFLFLLFFFLFFFLFLFFLLVFLLLVLVGVFSHWPILTVALGPTFQDSTIFRIVVFQQIVAP